MSAAIGLFRMRPLAECETYLAEVPSDDEIVAETQRVLAVLNVIECPTFVYRGPSTHPYGGLAGGGAARYMLPIGLDRPRVAVIIAHECAHLGHSNLSHDEGWQRLYLDALRDAYGLVFDAWPRLRGEPYDPQEVTELFATMLAAAGW